MPRIRSSTSKVRSTGVDKGGDSTTTKKLEKDMVEVKAQLREMKTAFEQLLAFSGNSNAFQNKNDNTMLSVRTVDPTVAYKIMREQNKAIDDMIARLRCANRRIRELAQASGIPLAENDIIEVAIQAYEKEFNVRCQTSADY